MPSISIIVPAHNEEALLGGTLRALGRAAANLGEDCEIVVVDDGSTDRTAEIATTLGARVVRVDLRHIAAARNAGARAAIGDVFVFVDADTLVPPAVLAQAVAAMRNGAVGGGSTVRMASGHARWAEQMMAGASWFMRTARWAAGCFVLPGATPSSRLAASTSATSPARRFISAAP